MEREGSKDGASGKELQSQGGDENHPFFLTILNEFFISLSVKLEKFIIDTVSFYLVKILNYVFETFIRVLNFNTQFF